MSIGWFRWATVVQRVVVLVHCQDVLLLLAAQENFSCTNKLLVMSVTRCARIVHVRQNAHVGFKMFVTS